MNVLSNLLNVASTKRVFSYHPKCKRIGLTHLCFADDLLIFCKGSIDSVMGVQTVLDQFYFMSRLKLNASKCEMYAAGIPDEQINTIKEITGFKLGCLPVRYLGVSLVTSKLAVKDYQSLIDKLRTKLSLWANKHLSFAGMLQFVRSVLLSISSYWYKQLILPKEIIRKVEQLYSRFFWKGSDAHAKGARVSWKIVFLLKSEGRLGIKDVGGWNKSCIVQLIRKLLANKGSLCVAWMHSYVIRNADFWQMEILKNASWSFKYLLKIRPDVAHLFSGQVCDHSTRLLTRVRLLGMGLAIETDKCLLCGNETETRDHLFFECRFAKELWAPFLNCVASLVELAAGMVNWLWLLCYQGARSKEEVMGDIKETI
ncbi:uncharacterized protein LOC120148441 [Hibiscus syriacus]|uniref:uncharacterized protein LOC120148441 n=1 Tax=Hibiscus syriacus TaxID=106335 RepID=UPI0019223381|nr:uncharacterized protein LOC120148441 [Hibiscus syriacus]